MYYHYNNKYKYIWCINEKEKISDAYKNIIVCKYLTIKYIFYIMTAKYIITNSGVDPFLPLRKKQKLIYTWHGGGAYKKIDENAYIYKKKRNSKIIMRNIRAKMISNVISSCEIFTDICSNVWNVSKECFLPIGMPRNDILFIDNDKIKQKVYKYYNIDPIKKIILFAPTFRGEFRNPDKKQKIIELDVDSVLNSLWIKYNIEFIFLIRLHYIIDKDIIKSNKIISATKYPDMQELLCSTEILITDYSSSMWDFSFTYRPCFIFAPDLDIYQKEQGFYLPIEEWPFPLAETNKQLIDNIINFDLDKYVKCVKKHHYDLGSYETGTATKQFCEKIFK
jgi:CDP-glycerol glycerophosphotransferase